MKALEAVDRVKILALLLSCMTLDRPLNVTASVFHNLKNKDDEDNTSI